MSTASSTRGKSRWAGRARWDGADGDHRAAGVRTPRRWRRSSRRASHAAFEADERVAVLLGQRLIGARSGAQMTSTLQRANRREFVAKLLAGTPDALVIAGLGSPAYDVFAGDRDRYYYLWGAMGGAAPMGAGPRAGATRQAGGRHHRRWRVADGHRQPRDRSARKQPKNLTIVVLDNGLYGETGRQRVAHRRWGRTWLRSPAAAGSPATLQRSRPRGSRRSAIRARRATTFAQVRVEADEPPRALPPRGRRRQQERVPRRARPADLLAATTPTTGRRDSRTAASDARGDRRSRLLHCDHEPG